MLLHLDVEQESFKTNITEETILLRVNLNKYFSNYHFIILIVLII